MLRLIALIAVLLLAVSLLGCRTNEDESELAEAFLLTLEDFPEGWKELPEDPADDAETEEATDPFEACTQLGLKELHGIALSPSFADSYEVTRVVETVLVFHTPEDAAPVFEEMTAYLSCWAEVVNQGGIDTAEVTFSEASLQEVSMEPLGDASEHHRLQFVGSLTEETDSLFSSMPIFKNVVMVSKDRFWFMIEATTVLFPTDLSDAGLLETLAQKTLDRITGAIPTAASGPIDDGTAETCLPAVMLQADGATAMEREPELVEWLEQVIPPWPAGADICSAHLVDVTQPLLDNVLRVSRLQP